MSDVISYDGKDFYGEWIHRGCGGNLIILIDAGTKVVEGEEVEGLIFKLKCTKCPYEEDFVFLSFGVIGKDEEDGDG